MLIATLLASLVGCGNDKSCTEGFGLGADGNCYPIDDGDSDADTDADSDTDTDADTDADTDTDIGPSVQLAGQIAVVGYTPTADSTCVMSVYSVDQVGDNGVPLEGELAFFGDLIECPTEETTPVSWNFPAVPIEGLTEISIFATFDGDGDAATTDDSAGSPVPPGAFPVKDGATYEMLDVTLQVGATKGK